MNGKLGCISYPNTWYTLKRVFDTHVYFVDKSRLFPTALVAYGYYNTMQELDIVKAMNEALRFEEVDKNNIDLKYNALTNALTSSRMGWAPAWFNRMSNILGLGPQIQKQQQRLKVLTWKICSLYQQ